ncbi:MAG: carbohydrate-binding family 9-like protein [Kofleriaceae bacterium]
MTKSSTRSRGVPPFARRVGWLAALATLAACVDRGAGPDPGADATLVARHALSRAPAELTPRLDAGFGGSRRAGAQVIYLGNLVDRDVLVPGQPFEVRHFWQVVTPPDPDVRVISFLRGDAADFLSLDDSPMRRAHPPARWRAGEIFEDPQRVVLRPDWRASTATLFVGMAPRGRHRRGERVRVHNGPVRDGVVLARQFAVDLSQAPPPPGTWRAVKAAGPIVIDGIAQEPAWQTAPWSADFPTAEGSPEPGGRARAKLTWDDRFLYVFASIEDRDVASPYRAHDDPLWKADCVEVFIDADRNQRQYVELQVNPWNAHFDSYFATTRAQPGDVSFDAGLQSQVVVHGTADQQGDTDVGWDVELAIPWAAVKGKDPSMPVTLPPADGDRFRLNVVRVDKRAGDKHPTASSWNRITYGDFHALDRMLEVVFVAPRAPAAAPVPSAAAPAPPDERAVAPAPGPPTP